MPKLIDITGKAISGEWGQEALEGEGIPVLRTTNFTNEGIIKYDDVVTRHITKRNIADKMLRNGDIIIEKSGGSDKQPVGRVVYFDGEENKFLFNNFTGLLRVKDTKKWMPRYVFYSLYGNYINGGTKAFENRTTGLHNLQTTSYVMSTEVRDAALDEQAQIVKRLDFVMELIAKHRKQLEFLDVLVKSRFIELFGDPLSNDKGWQKVVITGVCHAILGGGTPSKSHPEYFAGSIPWVSPKDMKSSVINDSIDHITEEAIAHSTTNLVPANSVLMVIRSGILKHTLPVAINSLPVTINQDLKAFVPNETVKTAFLMHLFKAIENDVLAGVRGVTADNIDFKAFQKRTIIVPPLELQEQFADFVKQVDKSKHYSMMEVAA